MEPTTRALAFGAFEMMNPTTGMPTWTHPKGKAADYGEPAFWIHLAKVLEAANFDFLFFADTYGYPTIDGQLPENVARHGIQFPAYDPMLLIAALAQAAPTLGYVVTSPTTVERPYAMARRFATLDKFTDGRIGWNIVTGSSPLTTDGLFGIGSEYDHDQRYEVGDEFVDLCRALWLDVWDDDAVVNNPITDTYVDPDRIHPLAFEGRYFSSHGHFVVPPTRQRVPVLFQAGTSSRGRQFGARNAEAMFIQGQSPQHAKKVIDSIRQAAIDAGRDAHDVRVVSGVTVTVAPTEEEAKAKRAELEAQYRVEDAAIIFAGFTGIDLSRYELDMPLTGIDPTQGQTLVDRYASDPSVNTVGDVLNRFRVQSRGFSMTGSPEQVAEQLIATAEYSDLDGYMLEPTFGDSGAYEDFIRYVKPILVERGAFVEKPREATLRERLGFPGPRPTWRPEAK